MYDGLLDFWRPSSITMVTGQIETSTSHILTTKAWADFRRDYMLVDKSLLYCTGMTHQPRHSVGFQCIGNIQYYSISYPVGKGRLKERSRFDPGTNFCYLEEITKNWVRSIFENVQYLQLQAVELLFPQGLISHESSLLACELSEHLCYFF
jgi:hypothetical protein